MVDPLAQRAPILIFQGSVLPFMKARTRHIMLITVQLAREATLDSSRKGFHREDVQEIMKDFQRLRVKDLSVMERSDDKDCCT